MAKSEPRITGKGFVLREVYKAFEGEVGNLEKARGSIEEALKSAHMRRLNFILSLVDEGFARCIFIGNGWPKGSIAYKLSRENGIGKKGEVLRFEDGAHGMSYQEDGYFHGRFNESNCWGEKEEVLDVYRRNPDLVEGASKNAKVYIPGTEQPPVELLRDTSDKFLTIEEFCELNLR